jgi:hypothetical protein
MAKAIKLPAVALEQATEGPVGFDRAEDTPSIAPSAEELGDFVGRIRVQQAGMLHDELRLANELMAEVSKITDFRRGRTFAVRCLLRAADFALEHQGYGPFVKKVGRLGISSCLQPGKDVVAEAKACWGELLTELDRDGSSVHVEIRARKVAMLAAVVAASLTAADAGQAQRCMIEAACVCLLIAEDIKASEASDNPFEEVRRALLHDLATLASFGPNVLAVSPSESGPLCALWPDGAPQWYRPVDLPEFDARPEELTPAAKPQTLEPMAGKKLEGAKPRKSAGDTLATALDTFADVKPPAIPVASHELISPENAAEVLAALAKYQDDAGEAVVGVLRVLLRGLHGKSFPELETTKQFTAKVQELLDRAGFAVVCPSCGETGRLEAASHHSAAAGAIRVRHGSRVNHSGKTVVLEFDMRKTK